MLTVMYLRLIHIFWYKYTVYIWWIKCPATPIMGKAYWKTYAASVQLGVLVLFFSMVNFNKRGRKEIRTKSVFVCNMVAKIFTLQKVSLYRRAGTVTLAVVLWQIYAAKLTDYAAAKNTFTHVVDILNSDSVSESLPPFSPFAPCHCVCRAAYALQRHPCSEVSGFLHGVTCRAVERSSWASTELPSMIPTEKIPQMLRANLIPSNLLISLQVIRVHPERASTEYGEWSGSRLDNFHMHISVCMSPGPAMRHSWEVQL